MSTNNTSVGIGNTNQASLLILDLGTAELSIAASTPTATEGGANGAFTLTTSQAFDNDIGINVSLAGTAISGDDYNSINTFITLPALARSITVPVAALDDEVVEGTETVTLNLLGTSNNALLIGTASSAQVMIDDDDIAEISVSATEQAIEREQEGRFTIASSKPFASAITINVSLAGTATEGHDYSIIGTSIVLPANTLSTTVSVVTIVDQLDEVDETVVMNLTGTSNLDARIGTADSASIIISNRLPRLAIQLNTLTVSEPGANNTATVTLMRSDTSLAQALTVNVSSSDPSRASVPSNATFASGGATTIVTVSAIDNVLDDGDQLITITASATNFVAASADLTVINDDLDNDGDGLFEDADNCPVHANPDQADFEGDGVGDACDNDLDGDGLPNNYETQNGLNPLNSLDRDADLDGDGFTNIQEFRFGTDPQAFDLDDDNNGVPDSVRPTDFLPAVIQFLLFEND